MTSGRTRFPDPASTPPRITDASLGTTGKTTSIADTANRYTYVHGEPETKWVSDSSIDRSSPLPGRQRLWLALSRHRLQDALRDVEVGVDVLDVVVVLERVDEPQQLPRRV